MSSTRKNRSRLWFILGLLVMASSPAVAQVTDGEHSGDRP
jgi:hypothetical protein